MKERLRRFMSAEAMNSTQLANELNIQASGISHILSGRNKPSYDFVTKLLTKFPNLNPDWLILGKGPMHRDEIRKKVDVTAECIDTPIVSSPTIEQEPNLFDTPGAAHIFEDKPSFDVPTSSNEKVNIYDNGEIERIILFFADGSFKEYTPSAKH